MADKSRSNSADSVAADVVADDAVADDALADDALADDALGKTEQVDTAGPGEKSGASENQGPVTSDIKSAFAAALERKKQAGQARSAHLDGHGGVGGATSSHKATRTFRRKSGSA